MSLLVISPDFASHYSPLAVLARAAQQLDRRVIVATGPNLRHRVEADGFEHRMLRLGTGSNTGIAECDPNLRRFIAATHEGPIATIRQQALDRERDLLWEPERVATEIGELCAELEPERVLVDHVSFGSTLGMYATGRPFVTLVPGHPSQLPVGSERYGVPAIWPLRIRPDSAQLAELNGLVDRVTKAFTDRWNSALAAVAPTRPPVDDAFRVHGDTVLYNSVPELQTPTRVSELPTGHRFVGPLVRDEALPPTMEQWSIRSDGRPQVYVSFGTFLSHRSDVIGQVADGLRRVGARAAIALGTTPAETLGELPDDWIVAPQLPQVAMMRTADLVVHHGGNNTVQEALAAGVRQCVLPFSTDQFSNAADLERIGAARVLAPNRASGASLVDEICLSLATSPPPKAIRLQPAEFATALFEPAIGTESEARHGR